MLEVEELVVDIEELEECISVVAGTESFQRCSRSIYFHFRRQVY